MHRLLISPFLIAGLLLLPSCSGSNNSTKVEQLEQKIKKLEDEVKNPNQNQSSSETEGLNNYKISVVILDWGVTEWFETKAEANSATCDYFGGIHEGDSLFVTDGSKNLIGKSKLQFKKRATTEETIDEIVEYGILCQVSTTVSVPKSSFYRVGAGERFGTYSFADLTAQNWKIVLGDDYLAE